MLRTVGGIVLVIGAVWLSFVVIAAVFQRQLIYLPDTSAPSPPPGVTVEEVAFTTDDGVDLAAWFLPTEDEQVTTVLFAPGNAGNRAGRVPMAEGLVDRGHAVLLLDYRGYGGNPGSPSEEGLIADARAARSYLDDRDDVDPSRIAYWGESLGTGVVASLALDTPPVAMVLRSPFPELADVGRNAYPFLPVGTLLRDRYPTAEHLEAYDGPVLVVAGERDRIVPNELSREVADGAGAEYVEIAGAGHNDRALFDGEEYLDAVDAHLRAAVQAGPDD